MLALTGDDPAWLLLDGKRVPFAVHLRGFIFCTMGSGTITWRYLPPPANSR